MANDLERLVRRFDHRLHTAAAYAARRAGIGLGLEHDDLYSHAALCLLGYAHGEGWTASARLSPDDGPEVDRLVQQALNYDLLNHIQAYRTTDAYHQKLDESDLISYSNKSELDPEIADYIDEHFPLMTMHYINGMALRAIAAELGRSVGNINHRLKKEKGEYSRWAKTRETQRKQRKGDTLIANGTGVFGRTRNKTSGAWNEHTGDSEQVIDYELAAVENGIDENVADRRQRLSLFILERGHFGLTGRETLDELKEIARRVRL